MFNTWIAKIWYWIHPEERKEEIDAGALLSFFASSECPNPDLNPNLHQVEKVRIRIFLVAQMLTHLPTMQETQVQSLGREDLLEKEMAPHSSTLAWGIPWTEEPGGLQSMGSQRVGHDWATSLSPGVADTVDTTPHTCQTHLSSP